jgi:uncharacterized membrane protein YphA (DoxX/SURF4 family)
MGGGQFDWCGGNVLMTNIVLVSWPSFEDGLMTNGSDILLWLVQLYLVRFFLRSAYRKTINFEKVSDEFRRWGYPLPRKVTFFLIIVWTLFAPLLLFPSAAGEAAMVLLMFMIAAFFTLVVHKEWRRLIEPTIPIILLCIVVFSNSSKYVSWFR